MIFLPSDIFEFLCFISLGQHQVKDALPELEEISGLRYLDPLRTGQLLPVQVAVLSVEGDPGSEIYELEVFVSLVNDDLG